MVQYVSRAYPVDDAASSVADDGQQLPPNVVVDLNLRWPDSLGVLACLTGVSVTPALVTVVIQSAYGLDDLVFAPLAVVAIPQPVLQGRIYALTAQVPGAGGWIVFGSGVNDQTTLRARFSSPRQARLAPRAARAYRSLPVVSLRALGNAVGLDGVVRLRTDENLSITRERREIDGALRTCAVVRLVEGGGPDGFPVPTNQLLHNTIPSVFQQFAGPCAGRPESHTCGVPEPIEFINAVPPDCNGRLTILFQGSADLTRIEGGGVAVDSGLGLAQACLPPQLPGSDSMMPDEYAPVQVPPLPPPPPPPPPGDFSESLIIVGSLPYLDCFDGGIALDFVVKAGLWALLPLTDTVPTGGICPSEASAVSAALSASSSSTVLGNTYETRTTATRNVSVWEGFDVTTIYRKCTTDVLLLRGPDGARHNAGIVANFHLNPSDTALQIYYLAEIDYDTQELRVSRFNGASFQPIVAAQVPGIQLKRWYELALTVGPGTIADQATLTVDLLMLSTPGTVAASLSVAVNHYGPSTGRFGLHTNRALASFSGFKVEEAP